MTMRRFELHRDQDPTGASGTGHVAQGVVFDDGVACLRWLTEWPTSVVWYDRGVEAVEKIHGHGGASRIVWLDDDARRPDRFEPQHSDPAIHTRSG